MQKRIKKLHRFIAQFQSIFILFRNSNEDSVMFAKFTVCKVCDKLKHEFIVNAKFAFRRFYIKTMLSLLLFKFVIKLEFIVLRK